MTGTHVVPRYNAERTAKDVALLVANGDWNATMADTCMDAVKRHDGDILPMPGCPICGARMMESVATGRYEIEHDYAKHSQDPAQKMASAADAVERQRAESLRRARERDEE